MTTKQVTIYTTKTCPHCNRAKMLFNSKGLEYIEINVDDSSDREMMISKANGRRTVPQIFIGDVHVGGADDLYNLESENKLDQMLS
ncbi:MAG: glutaredoxin 3 [Rickettsiaceae bacterium]